MADKIILLVEDTEEDEVLTVRALKKNSVLNRVAVVRDGQEALDYLFCTGSHSGRDPNLMPQLVILDLKLPKLDGLEVLRRMRSDSRTAWLPVIILTSSKEEQDLINGYRLGANAYVRKPVDFDQFAEAVRHLKLFWLVVNEPPPSGGPGKVG